MSELGKLGRRFLESFQCVEEAVKEIAFDCGHKEDMGVRYSPSPGIQAHKFRLELFHHFLGGNPCGLEQAFGFFPGQVVPPGGMSFGDDQAVSFGEGVDVQDAH